MEDLTIEEVTGRLKAVDNREEAPPTEPISIGGRLLYAEDQWLARQKEKKRGGGEGSGTSKDKDQRRRPRGGKKGKPKVGRDGGGQADKAGATGGEP